MTPAAVNLPATLQAWPGDDCARVLKNELEGLPTGSLPLHLGLTEGGRVDDSAITATVLSLQATDTALDARVGVFFTEVIGGCNCADDPIEKNVYCELLLRIDKRGADTDISAAGD